MGNMTRYSLLCGALLFAAWSLSGCYTELQTTESEHAYAERVEYGGTGGDTTSTSPGEYSDEDYEHAHTHFYYDSYYPGFTFGIGVGLGYWGYSYPWYGGYYPWYGGYYPPYYGGYYPPYYGGYYPPYYSGYYAPYYGTRHFGNTRMTGTTRGSYSGITAGTSRTGTGLTPGALSRPSGSSRSSGTLSRPSGNSRSSGTLSRPSINSNRLGQTSPSRSPTPRLSTGRRQGDAVAPSSRNGTVNQGGTRRSSSGGRYTAPSVSPRGSGDRSYGRSYSPPASRSAPAAAPAARSGGGGGGGGGSRGGGGGGGRR